MINIYAIVDADGQVERLSTGLEGVPIPDGHIAVTLVDTVTSWPTPPSDAHALICSAQGVLSWSDTRTLAQAKADAWVAVKAEREQRLTGTFTHAGNTYDIDPTNLAGASIDAREALIAGEPWSQMWVLADNTVVTLTAPEMIAVGRACKTAVSGLWATSQYLRGLIEAATTPEQVAAITWP